MSRCVFRLKSNLQWTELKKKWLICHACRNNKILSSLIKKRWFSVNFRTLKSWKLMKLMRLLRQLWCSLWTSFSWMCYLIRLKFLLTLICDSGLRMCLLKILLNSLFAIIEICYKFSCVFWIRIFFSFD